MADMAGLLPTIKCSNCNAEVEISAMAEHVCVQVPQASPVSPPPDPEDPIPYAPRSPDAGPVQGTASPKASRSGLPRIDPSVANRPFLRPDPLTPASSSSRYSPFSAGNKSPLRRPERTVTSPLPRPPSPEVLNLDCAFPPFPLPSKSRTLPQPKMASPVASKQETNSSDRGEGSVGTRGSSQTFSSTPGDPISRPSTSNSSRRPSVSSVSRGARGFMDDEAPPMPSGLPTGFTYESPSVPGNEQKRAGYGGPDSEITEEPQSYDNEYRSSSAGPSLALHRTRTLPVTQDGRYNSDSLNELPQKPSGASDASQLRRPTISERDVLPIPENKEYRSFGSYATSSTGSSPSETTSQSSFSSAPSVSSRSSRRKPSDLSKLDMVLKELQPFQENKQEASYNVDTTVLSEDSVLAPPKIGESFYMPDSPTDPAMEQGGLSFMSNNLHKHDNAPAVPRPSMTRSATEPLARRPVAPRKRCRGCDQIITGKSVSSADGRLTGRYHKTCFVCYTCRAPFQTADFYVLDDHPYCAQHYHELNGSLCATCNTGIEGQYLETNERAGRGSSDRPKFHPDCLKCRTCRIVLRGEYFEWNGHVYCERDARRAAASTPLPGRRRPTMPSSPLAQSYGPPPGPSSRGPRLRPEPRDYLGAPGGARRFPERRTTKLMVI
ncbi:hypothetical protein DTO164E3_4885 [Paecilomyces variotii]|uniref:LIM zinc-binding domain-containing protein n=1 Tax=Byssochlamys spectabilis TaxID=264951 RepID=A0A443HR96_BYSSP|nr:hypothetical protein C8Q69DRAFT_507739 [Paecilomyces variotii]KAJ9199181.1 hypothetical protein DTO164E3_4885 [Paecilomyces variotii]KAJ9199196.1 hypothetical protein DTO032I3_5092 [Paecilomyces variotii]KAJ9255649.1 hypothetical protein DTO207G8_3039 [Paecilomyces variotii]KAJ9256899.1 hypothetical protein DTO195F2_5724 [Paecilomyces variotii]KAJ9277503.1 hypothetical protein DTO021D3_5554 [Paecilomyces variotii]